MGYDCSCSSTVRCRFDWIVVQIRTAHLCHLYTFSLICLLVNLPDSADNVSSCAGRVRSRSSYLSRRRKERERERERGREREVDECECECEYGRHASPGMIMWALEYCMHRGVKGKRVCI